MTQDEIEARHKAVASLLKREPNVTGSEAASLLGISETAFRRYKRKIKEGVVEAVDTLRVNKYKNSYRTLLKRVLELEKELNLKTEELKQYTSMANIQAIDDIKVHDKTKREVVPVIVASDWHIEETVDAEVTNGLNEYNLSIAEDSVRQFFSEACCKIRESQSRNKVTTVVLALLGDIINGVLRDEDLESNQTTPVEAIAIARSLIHKGIETLIKDTGCNIRVICCVGNHGRLTEKIHYSNQVKNNLEYLMYRTLAEDFKENPKVKFIVRQSYYTIQPIFGVKVRFHHGHAARFNGGIGGLAVPVLRKTQQMNTIEHADLDVIGHFHAAQMFSNVIVNGSLVGSNGYSMALGLPHDIPKQTYFEIDSVYGRTVVAPICIDRKIDKNVVDGI